jgi:glyoxylase-like metal-dependent hydrolase (beta-lactamase superfamily II)
MMKTLALAIVIAAMGTFALQAQQTAVRTGTLAERHLTAADFPQNRKIADGIYIWSDVHPSGVHTTNNLIVVTSAGVLVADGQKDTATTRKMVDFIKGLTNQPIRYVIVCSEHGDHSGGNEAFPPDAVFVSSPASQASLSAQAKGDKPGGPKTIVPTETVGDRRVLKLGDTEIQIVNSGRAHTGGDIEVYLAAEKIFFVSEAFSFHLFPNSRTAVPGEWLQTLRNIQQVKFNALIPGHGFFDDQTIMRDELVTFTKLMEFTIAEATRTHNAGVGAEAATRQIDWGPYSSWPLFADRAQTAVQRTYDELDGRLK